MKIRLYGVDEESGEIFGDVEIALPSDLNIVIYEDSANEEFVIESPSDTAFQRLIEALKLARNAHERAWNL